MRVKLVKEEPKERGVVSRQLQREGLPEKVRANRCPKTRYEVVIEKSRLGHPDQRTTSSFLAQADSEPGGKGDGGG